MKKIWGIIVLIFFPTILFSQWSLGGSVSTGISKVDNDYMTYYKDSKGKMGLDFSVTARYTIWYFYASTGVGYQSFKSESGYEMRSSTIDYKSLNPEFSYANVYVPVTVGFLYDRWKVYPVAEVGVNVNFPVSLKDRLEIGNEVTTKRGVSKSVVPAFVVQGGVGYGLSERCSLEAKLRYSTSGNVSNHKKSNGSDYKSTWQYIGGQVSFVMWLF